MLTKFLSLLLIGGLILVLTPIDALSKEYVGVAKCKMCHNKPVTGAQYTKWAASKHANAFKDLKDADAKNPKCLKCHSTAFGLELNDSQTITLEEGVSCESCHGAGSGYKMAGIMKDQAKSIAAGLIIPDEKVCRKCHNPESPNYKEFNFKTFSAKIAHPNPAKEK